jgi:hypothetical protein
LEYSQGYTYRVCADISHVALLEARGRISDHGLFVVSDVANLPFKAAVFDGVVSLHTLQHLPESEYIEGYRELYRVLAPLRVAVVVNRWRNSRLMQLLVPMLWLANRILLMYRKFAGKPTYVEDQSAAHQMEWATPKKTFIHRQNASWLKQTIGAIMPIEIFVWRSVNTQFLRTMIHRRLGGRWILKFIYWMEEQAPRFFGEYGQYPLIIIRKP